MNEFAKGKIAGSGGIVVVMGFVFGVLLYIALKTFVLGVEVTNVEIFALLTTIIFAGVIGFVDDLFGWVHGGLSIKLRLALAFISAIPLMVINAGHSLMSIPFIGLINIGLIYPLILVPLGIVGAMTTYNFLAGVNGLEAGQGIILVSFLSFISYLTGTTWLSLIGLFMVGALVIFYFYNKYPARILPGDVLTYPIGALIACMAILGNFEKIAVFVFIPYIIETILKIRGKIALSKKGKKGWPQSFGIPNKDNTLKEPYGKIYSLTHLSMRLLSKIKGKVYEKDISYIIFATQIIICLLSLVIFREALF